MVVLKTDAVLSAAVDQARVAAEAEAGHHRVGDHLGYVQEVDRVGTHRFVCLHPGYHGWYWAVTLSRASRARTATVDDVVLLPGEDALLAPRWVPWSDRVAPGDVAPGMLLATAPEDPRLVPGYTAGADPKTPDEAIEVRAVVRELGLGRTRVLSKEGRDEACLRWTQAHGADQPEAKQAPAPCASCGYFIRLRGELGAAFGVCANAYSSSDGVVVAIDHGCGAHSDVIEERRGIELPPLLWDDAVETRVVTGSVFD
ncbi:MAG: DUF3027 domain-containing protein [Propionibacteriaceae bacterium]|jgi:hypothetical protein|nr:DUF3027 domain-containing protein [Propionibacteriaceae bacterium]